MVFQTVPIEFADDDPRPLLTHLDRWAATSLATAQQWSDMIQRAGQWADYSPRNQVLLASYGIVGPVAGASTWSEVPSAEDGREVGIRVGEHALLVRVPVTAGPEAVAGRTSVDGRSRSVAAGFRWEPVFALEQLARRPRPDVLAPVAVPPMSDAEWAETVRAASTAIMGRQPRTISSVEEQLTKLASRVPLTGHRRPLPPVLAGQAAWLVADRVGRSLSPIPDFDPSALKPRERWQRLEDVRHATDRVTRSVSTVIGVDLSASSLPRWSITDDRTVAPGRRNYLSRSDVAGLVAGVWSEVGPYSQPEWAQRGRPDAIGRAAFLKATDRSYLAVYETVGGARWTLESAGRGRHLGLVAEGEAVSMPAAKADARVALRARFPDVARTVDAAVGSPVLSPTSGWMPMIDGRDDRTQERVFSERVSAVVAPGPGGTWGVWTSVDGHLAQSDHLAPTQADAKRLAEGLARGKILSHATMSPDAADRLVADMASTVVGWDRTAMVKVVGTALTDADRARLMSPDLTPSELVGLLADSGRVTPSTMLQVLWAEQVDPATAASLTPNIGIPVPAAITTLSDVWGISILEAGTLTGATATELREAGATLAELIAAAPAETLRRLAPRPETWEQLGPTLMEAGLDAVGALRHIADHAPTPSTMAVAVASIVEASDGLGGRDPVIAALTIIGRRVTPDDLAAVTERFGLDPHQSASALTAAGVAIPDTVHTVIARTDGDIEAARTIMTAAIGLSEHGFDQAIAPEFDNVIQFRPIDARSANEDLISALAQPSRAAEVDSGVVPVLGTESDAERVPRVERSMSTARDL